MSETWIALLGERDTPTDGLEDYCSFLAGALARHGTEVKIVRVAWNKKGWASALWDLWRKSANWRGKRVLVQYTALSWSRRGFPFGVLAVARILRWRGVRLVSVFHEFGRQGTSQRWINRARGLCQDRVIFALYRTSAKAVFTAPLEMVGWLPNDVDDRSVFIPIGANIPERLSPREPTTNSKRSVAVFGVTEAPNMLPEAEAIATIMREAAKSVPALRLVLVGRGSSGAEAVLAPTLVKEGVKVIAKGILPAEQVSSELESADALLFVRGPVTLRRGSALAGIACGLPIVGCKNERIEHPLDKAGVEWAPMGDTDALARGLVRVLTDQHRWTELHRRNLQIQRDYFSWSHIAQRFLTALPE